MTSRTIRNALFTTVCAAALAFGAAGGAMAETLADAMISAYRNSNLLEQNRATLRAADEDVAQAVAALRPVVQWTADAEHQWAKISGMTVHDAGLTLSVGGQMTLFDFGRGRLAQDIAKEQVLATRSGLIGVEQDVLLATVQAYSDVKSATEQVAINGNSTRVLGEELRAARDRFDVGEVTRTDVSLSEAQLASARAALSAAEGALQVAREAFKAATGHYPESLAPMPPAPALPASLEEAQAIARRAHPAIQRLQHSVAAADLAVKAAAVERLPKVTGTLGLSRQDDINESAVEGLSASVGASQTIYSGGALPARHRQAIANRDSARATLRQAAVDLDEGVAQAWAQIKVYRAQISAYDQQIRAATVAYRGVREEATLGARTTLDVLDAEQDLLDARASRIEAEASLQVAFYTLLSAMGQLTVNTLRLGIPTYDPAAYYNAVKTAPHTSVQGESLDRVLRAIGKP